MFIIYDLIYLLLMVIYLPRYLLRRKFQRGFLSRLGFLPRDLKLKNPIWVHAVSVGEVMAVEGLLEELRVIYPDTQFVISTVTSTGNKLAKNIAKVNDFVTYLPLDFSFIVKRVLNRIRPGIFIIAETEIWPNLISILYKKKIPVVIVNGRISDKSFKGYLWIKFLLGPILNKINLFCVQTKRDQERLNSLGVIPDKIEVTGNMKFDVKDYADLKKDYLDYRRKLNLTIADKLWVAGSTHPQEEEIILRAYKKLLSEFATLRLMLAPRHPERVFEIEDLIKKFGFSPFRITLLNSRTQEFVNLRTVFILDTIGQLLSFYNIAEIVFVGGSLIKRGGHNILEPAILGKPIVFGPYMFNFQEIMDLFLKNNAAILVHNEAELIQKIQELLRNPQNKERLGGIAKQLVLKNQGATQKNARLIKGLVSGYA
jgi:3-deoxy-D-manno-octulosonic-acid transferase